MKKVCHFLCTAQLINFSGYNGWALKTFGFVVSWTFSLCRKPKKFNRYRTVNQIAIYKFYWPKLIFYFGWILFDQTLKIKTRNKSDNEANLSRVVCFFQAIMKFAEMFFENSLTRSEVAGFGWSVNHHHLKTLLYLRSRGRKQTGTGSYVFLFYFFVYRFIEMK